MTNDLPRWVLLQRGHLPSPLGPIHLLDSIITQPSWHLMDPLTPARPISLFVSSLRFRPQGFLPSPCSDSLLKLTTALPFPRPEEERGA